MSSPLSITTSPPHTPKTQLQTRRSSTSSINSNQSATAIEEQTQLQQPLLNNSPISPGPSSPLGPFHQASPTLTSEAYEVFSEYFGWVSKGFWDLGLGFGFGLGWLMGWNYGYGYGEGEEGKVKLSDDIDEEYCGGGGYDEGESDINDGPPNYQDIYPIESGQGKETLSKRKSRIIQEKHYLEFGKKIEFLILKDRFMDGEFGRIGI